MSPKKETVHISVGVIAISAVAALTLREYLQVHRDERAKRAKIEEDKNLNIEAIRHAVVVTQERLRKGEYDKYGPMMPSAVMDDIRFETIVARYDK